MFQGIRNYLVHYDGQSPADRKSTTLQGGTKMMNEMVNQVARAIEDAQAADLEFKYDRPAEALARAAIVSMRKPPKMMEGYLQSFGIGQTDFIEIWQTAIDEMLK